MKTINVLPIEEIFYVKTIYFSVEYFGRLYTGKVVYKRNLSEHYVMDESKRSEIDKMFYYYPETCYPKDIIDEIILQGILPTKDKILRDLPEEDQHSLLVIRMGNNSICYTFHIYPIMPSVVVILNPVCHQHSRIRILQPKLHGTECSMG